MYVRTCAGIYGWKDTERRVSGRKYQASTAVSERERDTFGHCTLSVFLSWGRTADMAFRCGGSRSVLFSGSEVRIDVFDEGELVSERR